MSREVLVVDDDADVREAVMIALETSGHAVASAAGGAEALRWMETHGPPSLVLLDMMMPDMPGEELIAAIRREPTFKDVPIVIMTGHARAQTEARALGVSGYLVKPVELEELDATVCRFAQGQLPRS